MENRIIIEEVYKMKVLIVGGVAGGAGTVARLRRLDESAEIIMFDKGPYVSYSNCCLPYRLSNTVDETEKLVLMDPKRFASQYNIQARVMNQVMSIDRQNKKLKIRDLNANSDYEESYDKLVLATGADAIVPNIPGIDDANIFTVKTVPDVLGRRKS